MFESSEPSEPKQIINENTSTFIFNSFLRLLFLYIMISLASCCALQEEPNVSIYGNQSNYIYRVLGSKSVFSEFLCSITFLSQNNPLIAPISLENTIFYLYKVLKYCNYYNFCTKTRWITRLNEVLKCP